MSDHSESPARPVSLFTVVILLGVFAAFYFFVRSYYRPVPVSRSEEHTSELQSH